MQTTISKEIGAAPDEVFRLARGVERWERLLPHYARSRAVERRSDGSLVVDFIARRPLVALLGLGLPGAARRRTPSSWVTARPRTPTTWSSHGPMVGADGREAARAATIALQDAGVEPAAIDYVNAHASSTPLGDVAEARAIALALGERSATVPVSGTKAYYGHPLGASGAIEAAICALAIRDGWAPGSVNLDEPGAEIASLLPGLLREGRDGAYRRVLSTSFGFGGLNAALVLGAVDLQT